MSEVDPFMTHLAVDRAPVEIDPRADAGLVTGQRPLRGYRFLKLGECLGLSGLGPAWFPRRQRSQVVEITVKLSGVAGLAM